jgi:hypothetical protein
VVFAFCFHAAMQPNGVELLFVIGYKYNMRKVLCFIFKKDAGSSAPGEPYIVKFPNKF